MEDNIELNRMFQQLAIIKSRLEGFPFANHESMMLRDCIIALIRTTAGGSLPATLGGGVIAGEIQPGDQGHTVNIGDQMLRGGQEVAPGVVVYAPQGGGNGHVPAPQQSVHQAPRPAAPGGPATIDIEAGLAAMGQMQESPAAPGGVPGQIVPVPGSLMAQAMRMEAPEPEPEPEPTQPPPGIPAPGKTKMVITQPGAEATPMGKTQ